MTRALFQTALAFLAGSLLTAASARAHPAWGIAVDRQGQVYFSDLVRVWKIDARGRVSLLRTAEGGHTHDLNVDGEGNLYGADNSYDPASQRFFSAVWRMTPGGAFSYLLPSTDDPPEGIGIWRDRDGNSYHATLHPDRELLVLRRSPDGRVDVVAGSPAALRTYRQGVPHSVGGMAFGEDGALYFTHGASLSRLTRGGSLEALVRELSLERARGERAGARPTTHLFGVAVDTRGSVYVADYGNRRVLKLTPGEQPATVLRAEESWHPTGVALRGGELYVLEHGQTATHRPTGTRVRRLSPDGRVTTLATVGADGSANTVSPAGELSAVEAPEGTNQPGRVTTKALAGAGIGLFSLTVIALLARRRMR